MLRFGSLLTLNNLVMYAAYNLEKLLLGRFWGEEALGLYGRAYQLISTPSSTLNASICGVWFSALSRLQDDPIRQKRYFLKGYSLMLALTLPVTIACAVFAEDMIFILLGAKWADTVPIFRLLAPTIVIFALINPFGWFLYAIGRAGRSLRTAFVIAPLVITAYVIGLPYGPKGVAAAYSSAMAAWVIPHIAWCIHGTGISARDIIRTVSRPVVSGIVAALFAVVVQFYWGQLLSPLFRLILGGSVMIVCYSVMLLYVMGQKAFYLDLLKGLKKQPTIDKAGTATP
jgi:PST family polysaccharide transporter